MNKTKDVVVKICSSNLIFWYKYHFLDNSVFAKKLIFCSQLSCLGNQKILWGCLFGYKSLLNLNWHTIRFHDCHHSISHFRCILNFISQGRTYFYNYFWNLKITLSVIMTYTDSFLEIICLKIPVTFLRQIFSC